MSMAACYATCGLAWAACYNAGGLVAGTISAPLAPYSALACNAAESTCMMACNTAARVSLSAAGAAAMALAAMYRRHRAAQEHTSKL